MGSRKERYSVRTHVCHAQQRVGPLSRLENSRAQPGLHNAGGIQREEGKYRYEPRELEAKDSNAPASIDAPSPRGTVFTGRRTVIAGVVLFRGREALREAPPDHSRAANSGKGEHRGRQRRAVGGQDAGVAPEAAFADGGQF
jgi:hypothetical protein